MKKRIILLSSMVILSFFVVNSVVAQEKPQEPKKAKTEMVKKDVSSKCGSCPSLAKCNNEAAVQAKKEHEKECEGTVEKPMTASEKRKLKRAKKK